MEFSELFDTHKHYEGAEYFCKLFKIENAELSIENVTRILRSFALLPYENLSKILNLNQKWDNSPFRWPLDIIGDYEKFKLGGTCFALTFFLKTILDYCGYQTIILMADMKSGRNTHCTLLLDFGEHEYLLDPGYLLHYPLPLDAPHGSGKFQLTYDPFIERYTLFTFENGEPKRRYSFLKRPTSMADFSHYWQDSFHWMTMHGICLSRRDEEQFIYLHNHYLKMETGSECFKGNFKIEIAAIAQRWFDIPPEIVHRAEKALRDNLYHDRELGYKVPKWVK